MKGYNTSHIYYLGEAVFNTTSEVITFMTKPRSPDRYTMG